MKNEELKNLSIEELQKKANNTKTLIGVFIPLIIGLVYFNLMDYFDRNKVDIPFSVITFCSIGGLISLFPALRRIQKELKSRNT